MSTISSSIFCSLEVEGRDCAPRRSWPFSSRAAFGKRPLNNHVFDRDQSFQPSLLVGQRKLLDSVLVKKLLRPFDIGVFRGSYYFFVITSLTRSPGSREPNVSTRNYPTRVSPQTTGSPEMLCFCISSVAYLTVSAELIVITSFMMQGFRPFPLFVPSPLPPPPCSFCEVLLIRRAWQGR